MQWLYACFIPHCNVVWWKLYLVQELCNHTTVRSFKSDELTHDELWWDPLWKPDEFNHLRRIELKYNYEYIYIYNWDFENNSVVVGIA